MECSYLIQLLTVHYKSCHHIIPALYGSFNKGSESSVVSDLCLCSREVIHDVVTYGDITCVQKDLELFYNVFLKIYKNKEIGWIP